MTHSITQDWDEFREFSILRFPESSLIMIFKNFIIKSQIEAKHEKFMESIRIMTNWKFSVFNLVMISESSSVTWSIIWRLETAMIILAILLLILVALLAMILEWWLAWMIKNSLTLLLMKIMMMGIESWRISRWHMGWNCTWIITKS